MGNIDTNEFMGEILNEYTGCTPEYLRDLSKQLKTILQTTIKQNYLAKEFATKCDEISTELYTTLSSWISSLSEKIAALADDFTADALIRLSDEEPENITNLLVDSYIKYTKLMLEVSKLTNDMKACPPALKEVADASNKLYIEFNAVKEHVYRMCKMLDVEPDEFDTLLAKKIIDKTQKQDGAGDKDAQPTE